MAEKIPVTFEEIIKHVLTAEGGYVNDLVDPGGETKYGISKRTYPKEDIYGLTRQRAVEIYMRDYWFPSKAYQLPSRLRYIYFDGTVNHGIKTAIRLLQRATGIKDDGLFGPITLKAAESCEPAQYASERLFYYDTIIKQNPVLEKFRKGWYRRVNNILKLYENTI